MTAYFGVRHFSPACAEYVTEFLNRTKPDIVLIEGPSDLSDLIPALCDSRVRLPAAILSFTADAPVHTVLYPFTEFSPEYCAMQWAIRSGIPVQFCDLPSEVYLADTETEPEQTEIPHEESVYQKLETLTGLDHETFWEYHFEQCDGYEDFFAAVSEYGASLREFSEIDSETVLREAYMRRKIAEAEQQFGNVAVITGAFHTAGLSGVPYSEADKKLTAHLKTAAIRSTLMPYSSYRLSSRSGYGAGSKAPAFFEMLMRARLAHDLEYAAAEYLARLAEYQRKHGDTASAAEVIEALRLSKTLAVMRGGKRPALSDLRDAAVTCIGHGSFSAISHACADTEIGTRIGCLPEGTVTTSVQDDFIRQLHELKLERFRTAAVQELELDLRENLRVKSEKSAFLDLHRSYFLHRLLAAGVKFGAKQARAQDNATWAELWNLRWTPETEIQLVEASLNGDTVEQAAAYALNIRLKKAQTLKETASALSDAFLCGLPACVRTAAAAVQAAAAECVSPADAGETIGLLSAIVRFGNIRRIDPAPIIPLIEQLYLRFCLELETASKCDDSAAADLIPALAAVSDVNTAHDFLDGDRLRNTLLHIADDDFANPLLSGYTCALLTEQNAISQTQFADLMHRRLSHGTPPSEAAGWFEGLSKRNRRALIARLSLWEQLCNFLTGLDDEEFRKVLVVLRRTFSEFSPGERSEIAENIGEILGLSDTNAAEVMLSGITAEEQADFSGMDEFDFDDI